MPPPSDELCHVLIVNQHGDNRGDEAAMTAVFDALADRLGPVRFTVLHQFNDPAASSNPGGHDVRFVPLLPRGLGLPRLLAAVALSLVHLPWRGVAGPLGREVIDAYRGADLVVSAPGGPYFGDIYANHEPLHWFYAVLAPVYGNSVFLYASSAGPFRRRLRNPARRFVLRRFSGVVVREERSAEYLRELFNGQSVVTEVTIDAALGVEVTPLGPDEWPGRTPLAGRNLVAVSAIDYAYPGPDRESARRNHDDAVVAALAHLSERLAPAHIMFLPQVHGRHADRAYLERLAGRLPAAVSTEVLSDGVPSRVQQRVFASAAVVLAGRYHPAVFSVLGAVPVACIAYEHKSIGLMETASLGHLVLPIDDVTTDRLRDLVDRAVDDGDAIRQQLREARPALRARSLRTADLAVASMQR